jgi:Tfp pilus assembly major pilin PilA
MLGFLVKLGVAGIVGAVAVKAVKEFELDKKFMELVTPLVDKALTSMVTFSNLAEDPTPTSPATEQPTERQYGAMPNWSA